MEIRVLIFEKPVCLRMLDCLKKLFVTRAALFLESTSKNEKCKCNQGLGVDLGVSRAKDTASGVIS